MASGSLGLHWLWAGPEPPQTNLQQGGCTWSPYTEAPESFTSNNCLSSKSYKSSVTQLQYFRSYLSPKVRVETTFILLLQRGHMSLAYSLLYLSVALARPDGTVRCGCAGSLIWLISRGKILRNGGLKWVSEKLRSMKWVAQGHMAGKEEEGSQTPVFPLPCLSHRCTCLLLRGV